MINKGRVDEIVKQIQNVSDPASLDLIIKDHTESITKLSTEIAKVQADIVRDIIPILTLPSPTPTAIVEYLAKLAVAEAKPQLKAQVKMTIQLGELSAAVKEIASAISTAKYTVSAGIMDVNNTLFSVTDELNKTVATALANVGKTQDGINAILGRAASEFDTSDIEKFNNTAAENLASLEANFVPINVT